MRLYTSSRSMVDTWSRVTNPFHTVQSGPTPEQTFIINFLQGFERGMNEKGMHLLLDRWWGIWFDWCRRQTQQRSEPCGNRSWEAYAIPSDWCGLRCQKRSRIKLEGTQAHTVLWCMMLNPIEIQVSKYAAHHFKYNWSHNFTRSA